MEAGNTRDVPPLSRCERSPIADATLNHLMSVALFKQVKHALRTLKPSEVRAEASRKIRVGLVAATAEELGRMETILAPEHLSRDRRLDALEMLVRGGGSGCNIELYESSLEKPRGAFAFDLENPKECVRHVLNAREDLMLPLARQLEPFRQPVCYRVIHEVAKENALFCLATALPDVVPNILSLPWSIAAYGSDSVFLTVNQVRMAFLLAAASDRRVGYSEQRSEIASITAGSFGWRAIARELAGKIPLGGGLIPKAGIAWAGTYAVGLSIERLYRLGYGFTRAERRAVYEEAFEHGKRVAVGLVDALKHRPAA